MTDKPAISFARFAQPEKGTAVLLVPSGLALEEAARACDPQDVLPRAFEAAGFTAELGKSVEVLAPQGSSLDRLVAVGVGDANGLSEYDWLKIGGSIAGAVKKAREITVITEIAGIEPSARNLADLALGITLRAYSFDKYKTKKEDREDGKARENDKPARYTVQCADPAAAKKAAGNSDALAGGVWLARDLVNEPANILGTVEFAARAKELEALGVKVEILTEKELKKLGMGALLGVAQGSARPPRVAVMQWKGGKARQKPVAFIGKGVVFDSGGLSIKPAGGMEDMKGDMGGAAAVTGLMHTLAARKAKVNAVGVIGLVENMVDAGAQRPGDIVTSMSGQTIEVLNTDAEGRLVLADVLWYCNDRFKPRFMVNLATLTGAIIVALGNAHAGLFSNDDELAERLTASGLSTGEKVWRMPLAPEYDKVLDSKNADMKNIGGRPAGAITAAQFLQRFVKDTPWAHLDMAGTAMGSLSSEINQSWASGYGVRLLDRLVSDHYEK